MALDNCSDLSGSVSDLCASGVQAALALGKQGLKENFLK